MDSTISNMQKSAQAVEGFTLIEIMVVVSIITMLSSVVLASLTQAKEKGRIAAGLIFDSHTFQLLGGESAAIRVDWNHGAIDNVPFSEKEISYSEIQGNVANSQFSNDTPSGSGRSYNLNTGADPKDSYLEFRFAEDFPVDSFSVTMWIKPASPGPDKQYLVSFNPFPNPGAWYTFGATIGRSGSGAYTRLCYGDSEMMSVDMNCQSIDIPLDRWTQIAFSYNDNSKTWSHFIDGRLRGSYVRVGVPSNPYVLNDPCVGDWFSGSASWWGPAVPQFQGLIDNFSIYSKAIL